MMKVGNIIRNLTVLKSLTNFVIPIGEERYSQCQSCSQFSKCQGQYVVSANPVKCSQLFSIFSEDR